MSFPVDKFESKEAGAVAPAGTGTRLHAESCMAVTDVPSDPMVGPFCSIFIPADKPAGKAGAMGTCAQMAAALSAAFEAIASTCPERWIPSPIRTIIADCPLCVSLARPRVRRFRCTDRSRPV
jgi:hypothetical protein